MSCHDLHGLAKKNPLPILFCIIMQDNVIIIARMYEMIHIFF